MKEVEFLIEVDVLVDEIGSLDGNIVPHTIVLVADVGTKVNSYTDPGKGETTQLNITNLSIYLSFTFFRIFKGAEPENVSLSFLFTCHI